MSQSVSVGTAITTWMGWARAGAWRRFLPNKRRQHQRLTDAASGLQSALIQLPPAMSEMETQFLAMQEKLAELAPTAQEIVERGHQLVRLAKGNDTGSANFSNSLALLEGALHDQYVTEEGVAELLAGLHSTVDQIALLLELESTLTDAVAPLDYVQVMLRVESARLPSAAQQVFTGLTDEIAGLCHRVQESFSGNFQAVSRLHLLLTRALRDLELKRSARRRAVEQRRTEISAALHRLAEEIQRNEDGDLEITAVSSELSQNVNAAIIALQSHDIVTQRLVHTRDGLREAQESAAQHLEHPDAQGLNRIQALMRIEVAQLDDVAGDLVTSETALGSAVRAIHGRLESIDTDCLLLREFSEITTSVNGTVQVILESFTSVRELLRQATQAIAEVESMLRPAQTVAQELTGFVEDISHQMRLIALNAQIQATQIGAGTGLEVLAAHASDVSTKTNELGMKATAGVSEIAVRLEASLRHAAQLRSICQQQLQQLVHGGGAEESTLHAFRDRAIQEVQQLGCALDRARLLGSELLAVANIGSISAVVDLMRLNTTELAEASAAFCTAEGVAGEQLEEELRQRYTMAQERKAHERAMGRTDADLFELADEGATVSEFGEGVELL